MGLVTSGGNPGDAQGFYAYGRLRSGIIGVERSFTGQQKDFGTGLIYFKARYYDPELGIFISPDTVVPDPGNLFDWNRYMYVRGRAMNMSDPTGHLPCLGCIIDLRPIVTLLEEMGLANPLAPAYMIPAAMGTYQKVRESQTGEAPEPSLALTSDWYLETGEQQRVFGPESEITQALMTDEGVAQARQAFLDGGRQNMTEGDDSWFNYRFGLRDAARELGDVVTDGDWATSFLGGYQVEVFDQGDSVAEFRVHNRTGWASATRVWGFSFKEDEKRPEYGPGGNLDQLYIWQETIP